MPLFYPILAFAQQQQLLLFILQPNCPHFMSFIVTLLLTAAHNATLLSRIFSTSFCSAAQEIGPRKNHQILTRTMRRGYHIYITTLLFLLLISRSASARLLPTNQASSSSLTTKAGEDMASLMGLEECDERDEACVRRRMIAEAHLDYIYTQHHKPKGSP